MKTELTSQYMASLEMLKTSIEKCPDELWSDNSYKNIFWQVIYHTLHYTNLYLSEDEASFKPWEKHIENLHRFEHSHDTLQNGIKPFYYAKSELIDYLNVIAGQVASRIVEQDLQKQSGFEWLPMSKFELQLYNLQHLQHHIGQVNERLRQHGITTMNWIG